MSVQMMGLGQAAYDANYFGMGPAPSSAYKGYGPASVPHWGSDLAAWLKRTGVGPFLDVGCAYGHLVASLNRAFKQGGLILPNGQPTTFAVGLDWSEYAYANRVSPLVQRGDARKMQIADNSFGTVTSFDLLGRFDPIETQQVISEMRRVGKPNHLEVHLIDLPSGAIDPTRRNFNPLDWYLKAFQSNGYILEEALVADFNRQPAWSETDWVGRALVVRHVG